MNETALTLLVAWKMAVLSLFVFLYVIGGRRWKAVRRFVASGFLIASVTGISFLTDTFSLWFIVPFTVLIIGLQVGYGGETTSEKIKRRAFYGFMIGLGGLILGFSTGMILFGICQLVLATTASVLFGVLNPTTAVDEEALIALFCVAFWPFMV